MNFAGANHVLADLLLLTQNKFYKGPYRPVRRHTLVGWHYHFSHIGEDRDPRLRMSINADGPKALKLGDMMTCPQSPPKFDRIRLP